MIFPSENIRLSYGRIKCEGGVHKPLQTMLTRYKEEQGAEI